MPKKFRVEIVKYQPISAIPNAWSDHDYKALLELMDIDEGIESMGSEELKEMCYMSLTDSDADAAAEIVLKHLFKEALTAGKIQQLAHDMPEDKMWQRFPDPLLHQQLFNAYDLLRSAFNGRFAQPTGVQLTFEIQASNADDLEVFDLSPEASIARLLANGMDESAIINRLYSEQIAGDSFPEAKGIIWLLEELSKTESTRQYQITSSSFWLEELKEMEAFEATTHAESPEDEA
jgi:hypothetical protein